MSNWDWASNANATAYRTAMISLDTATKTSRAMDAMSNSSAFASNTSAFASNHVADIKQIADASMSSVAYASNMVSLLGADWSYGSNTATSAFYLSTTASNIASRANTMAEFSWYRSAWASNLSAHAMTYSRTFVNGTSNWDWGSNAASYASNTCAYTLKALENQVLLIAKLQQHVAELEKKMSAIDEQS